MNDARLTLFFVFVSLTLATVGCKKGPQKFEGTYCQEETPDRCFTLTALEGGLPANQEFGERNSMRLTQDGVDSTASECNWSNDGSCHFAFGPSTITYPISTPITIVEFGSDGHASITGFGGVRWIKR